MVEPCVVVAVVPVSDVLCIVVTTGGTRVEVASVVGGAWVTVTTDGTGLEVASVVGDWGTEAVTVLLKERNINSPVL